jgi:hypothetical protein
VGQGGSETHPYTTSIKGAAVMDMFFRILLLILSLLALGFTGWWFYLALFDRPRFHSLMEEVTWPRIPEQVQFVSALVMFPLMLIGVILLVINFVLVLQLR